MEELFLILKDGQLASGLEDVLVQDYGKAAVSSAKKVSEKEFQSELKNKFDEDLKADQEKAEAKASAIAKIVKVTELTEAEVTALFS